jgi:hypothetical protein
MSNEADQKPAEGTTPSANAGATAEGAASSNAPSQSDQPKGALDSLGGAVGAVGGGLWNFGGKIGGYIRKTGVGVAMSGWAVFRVATSSRYRNDVFVPQAKKFLRENWAKVRTFGGGLKQEGIESREMMDTLWKLSIGEAVSPEEKKAAKAQLSDLAKSVPVLGLFALPGGAVMIGLLAKCVPFDLFPTAFCKEKGIQQSVDGSEKERPAPKPPNPPGMERAIERGYYEVTAEERKHAGGSERTFMAIAATVFVLAWTLSLWAFSEHVHWSVPAPDAAPAATTGPAPTTR